jgi:hypothetical protein
MARAFASAAAAAAASAADTDREASRGAGLLGPTRAAFDRWFEAPWRRDAYDRMTLAHLARISKDSLGLVPPRYALSHDFLAAIAWIGGRNFLAEPGARPLTGPAYGGGMSEANARSLARFNADIGADIGVSAGPSRVLPVAALTP